MKKVGAIDFGFGFTKTKTDTELKRIPTHLGVLDSKSEDLRGVVKYDLVNYVVGDDVKFLQSKINIATIKELVKYYPIFLKWFLESNGYDASTTHFVTGLPPVYKEEKANIEKIFRDFGTTGDVVSQSVGIFADTMSDIKGETVLIIDGGYNTLDYLALTRNGEDWRKIRSGTLLGQGANKAIEFFKEELSGVADIIKTMATNTLQKPFEDRRILVGGDFIDASEFAENAVKKYALTIEGRLKAELGELSETVEQTVLGGGCANFLKGYVDLPNIIVPEKPEFSQVRGYYKIGVESVQ